MDKRRGFRCFVLGWNDERNRDRYEAGNREAIPRNTYYIQEQKHVILRKLRLLDITRTQGGSGDSRVA